MLDTRRVVNSMDVTATPLEQQEEVSMQFYDLTDNVELEDLEIDQTEDPMLEDWTSEVLVPSNRPMLLLIQFFECTLEGSASFEGSAKDEGSKETFLF